MTTDSLSLFMVSGSAEYHSAENLAILADYLEKSGIHATIVEAGDKGNQIPDVDQLSRHDVLVLFCRRLDLDPASLQQIQKWCWLGKPVIGIRTASHAFQNWPEFDSEILGGSYAGHGPDEPNLRVHASPSATSHYLGRHLEPWEAAMKVYRNPKLADDCTELLYTESMNGRQPLAWCRTVPETRGRVYYTAMGEDHDFRNPLFLNLLKEAALWTACRTGGYVMKRLSDIDRVKCPCGMTRRAFATPDNPLATLHMVDITTDSKAHYHRKLTELYMIVDGEGVMEINGDEIPVKKDDVFLIERGCRHRANGNLRIVNIPIPSFDPNDEWFV